MINKNFLQTLLYTTKYGVHKNKTRKKKPLQAITRQTRHTLEAGTGSLGKPQGYLCQSLDDRNYYRVKQQMVTTIKMGEDDPYTATTTL